MTVKLSAVMILLLMKCSSAACRDMKPSSMHNRISRTFVDKSSARSFEFPPLGGMCLRRSGEWSFGHLEFGMIVGLDLGLITSSRGALA